MYQDVCDMESLEYVLSDSEAQLMADLYMFVYVRVCLYEH